MTDPESLLARRFLMCNLLYRNAQKEGAVINMKLVELEHATEHCTSSEKVVVYKVWEHKTKGAFGTANLVIPQKFHDVLKAYIKHRSMPAVGCEVYVFLTSTGKQVTHLSDELAHLTQSFPTEFGVIKMSSTEMSKLTSTNVALISDNATIRSIANHMTHNTGTKKQYYQKLQGEKISVNANETINNVAKRP